MPPTAKEHHRSKSLLLFQKLLNQRDSASPLTILVDSLEQPGDVVVGEFVKRAQISRTKVVFVSFDVFRKPVWAEGFVKAWGKKLANVREEVVRACAPVDKTSKTSQRTLIILSSLNSLITTHPTAAVPFLSSLITPHASLLALHHSDIPTILPSTYPEYAPHPLATLTHLATALLYLTPTAHQLACQTARNRALAEPDLGISAQPTGCIRGIDDPSVSRVDSAVVRMDLRRKSGRQVTEIFLLHRRTNQAQGQQAGTTLSLLSDHPAFQPPTVETDDSKEALTTFNLGLTEKQKKDREEIVLPYFDAQTDVGGGEGGRILYEIGAEDFDDFDEEEDEEI